MRLDGIRYADGFTINDYWACPSGVVVEMWEMRPMTNFRVGGMKSLENIQLAK